MKKKSVLLALLFMSSQYNSMRATAPEDVTKITVLMTVLSFISIYLIKLAMEDSGDETSLE